MLVDSQPQHNGGPPLDDHHGPHIAPRRPAWGGRDIATYMNQTERWLRKQRERAKAPPPPVFRVGSRLVADLDEIDAWLEQWKARRRR
jgi:hypothetical protein